METHSINSVLARIGLIDIMMVLLSICIIYCGVPARRGLRRTALALGCDKTQASDLTY